MKKRAFSVILSLLLIIPLFGAKDSVQAAGYFTDINSSHRALKEINYLAEGRITQGSNNKFSPNKTVTRAEAATFIGRALQLNGKQRSTSFRDVGASSFASGYIQSAVEKGILSGYGGGKFAPGKVVTRGEMALMIAKAFRYSFNNTSGGAAHALMSLGIAQGTGNGYFSFNKQLIRADFAVFLARALNPDYRFRANTVKFPQQLTVNTNDLNVRTGPGSSYKKTGVLNKGNKVAGAYNVGAWFYIKAGSVEGYVHSAYINNEKPNVTIIPPGGVPAPKPDPKPIQPAGNVDPRIAQKVIVLDPGHGGSDPGSDGYGLLEKDVALATGLKVNSYLKKTPFQVKMTRSSDWYPTLSGRVSFAKRAGADVFVSIHNNAFNGSANGTETYYYSAYRNPNVADSKLLASKIQKRLITAWKLKDRGVKNGNFHVIRENTMPAVLVELGFIDNYHDNQKLRSPYWRDVAAKAISYGILDYYKAKGYQVDSLYNVIK
ncbi:N-acetylmuramoyl-L-alanine amidase [Bacillus xiapuensis]|uniref:N-acetylmuramoyl-L-alanine amidase n=1 Tax=Bacillus xiapuensis TaxID=2014075 RepID=UPI001E3CCB52|nr:N-acetylmuramoyl-L-alanine amidase [Bacillus xiapuensis]